MQRDVRKYFTSKKAQLKSNGELRKLKFIDADDFENWYDEQEKLEGKRCHYCRLEWKDLNKIVMNGILTSGRFPENGKAGRGKGRGIFFELDRKDAKGDYSRSNCVLVCYFCNNDKSDIFTESQYFEFLNGRTTFLEKMARLSPKSQDSVSDYPGGPTSTIR